MRGAGRAVRPATVGHLEIGPIGVHGRDAHLVPRQRPRLVETDHLDRAEVLDGIEAPDEDALPSHVADAEGERRGSDRREPLGHGRNGERGRDEEHLEHAVAVQDADAEHTGTCRRAEEHELRPHGVEVSLERRLRRARRAEQRVDRPELRPGPRRDDDSPAAAAGNERAHEGDAGPVGQRRRLTMDGDGGLGDRHAFAGQGRFVDRQMSGLQHPDVRRDVRAGSQHDDVARHELLGRDVQPHAVPHDGGRLNARRLERVDGPLGVQLGEEADDAVQDEDAGNQRRVRQPAGRQRQRRRGSQHTDRKGRELIEQHPERRSALGSRQAVGAVPCEPARGLRRREAGARGAERLENCLRGHHMPRRRRRAGLRERQQRVRRSGVAPAARGEPRELLLDDADDLTERSIGVELHEQRADHRIHLDRPDRRTADQPLLDVPSEMRIVPQLGDAKPGPPTNRAVQQHGSDGRHIHITPLPRPPHRPSQWLNHG